MRIISQDAKIDVPYDLSALSLGGIGNERQIFIRSKLLDEKPCIFANYSTEAKAIKAMEMLHSKYKLLKNLQVFANGTANYIESVFGGNELEEMLRAYENMNIFQFPKDEEIEV